MLSLPQSLTVRPVFSQDTQPPELEERDREQNEAPIIQGEMDINLLHHLDTGKSMGPGGIHPRVLRELAEVLTKPLSIISQQSWLTGEVPVDWRSANVMPIYKKGWKEELGSYTPVSLTSKESYGADHAECHHATHTGQPGDQAQSAWLYCRVSASMQGQE